MINYIWSCLLLAGIFLSSFFGNIPIMTQAVLDGAKEAVNLCIIMAAIVGLWSGIMEIGVESGLMELFAKKIEPFLTWLFPRIPKNSKAREYIAANCAANILGLGWAATPAGLAAMESLAKLEEERRRGIKTNMDISMNRRAGDVPSKEKRCLRKHSLVPAMPQGVASNEMCTFLILNISSLQLIPVNVITYRSQYGSVNPTAIVGPGIVATVVSTVVAIIFCKMMDRKRRA